MAIIVIAHQLKCVTLVVDTLNSGELGHYTSDIRQATVNSHWINELVLRFL